MASLTPIEEYAISRKIVNLKREGYPQDQAVAIAFRMWKDGELHLPRTQKQIQTQRTRRIREWRKNRYS